MKRLTDIYRKWYSNELGDGEALDDVLEVLETMQPSLKKIIIDTDGMIMTDEQALEKVAQYYSINRMMDIENNSPDVLKEPGIVEENKMMVEALKTLGFSQEQVSSICSGAKVKPILSDENFKAFAIATFTSDSENGAQDYDNFMEGGSELSIWEPFEHRDEEDMQELLESEFDSLKHWFKPTLLNESLEIKSNITSGPELVDNYIIDKDIAEPETTTDTKLG